MSSQDFLSDPTKLFAGDDEISSAHKAMMALALCDTGRFVYGIKAIEVWIREPSGSLKKADSGTWYDKAYKHNDDPDVSVAFDRLFNEQSPNYIREQKVVPGEGLVGALWTDTSGTVISKTAVPIDATSANSTDFLPKINWRDVEGLANDPDQPVNERIKLISKAGFKKAAGVPFNARGTHGIIVYMARKTADDAKLKNRLNEELILACSDLIGSVQALRKPRRFAAEERAKSIKEIFRRVRDTLLVKNKGFGSGSGSPQDPAPESTEGGRVSKVSKLQDTLHNYKDYWKRVGRKMLGGDVLPPPGTKRDVTIYIVVVAFITCFVMAAINTALQKALAVAYAGEVELNPNFLNKSGFELGQIAGATCMVYALTSAPAAQPRTIILGRFLSTLVGMTFNLIPNTSAALGWTRFAGAVSVSTALMAKLGLAHPPGAGLANIFLGQDRNWDMHSSWLKIGCLVLQDTIFVFLASFFNNLLNSRHYPTYWGHIPAYFIGKAKNYAHPKPKDV